MASWLKAGTGPAEDLSSVRSTQDGRITTTSISSFWDSTPLVSEGTCTHMHIPTTDTYTHTHTIKKIKILDTFIPYYW